MPHPCWVCTYVCCYVYVSVGNVIYTVYVSVGNVIYTVYVSVGIVIYTVYVCVGYIRMCGFACVYVGLPKYVWYDCRNKSPWKQHHATTCDRQTSSQGKGKQLPWLPMTHKGISALTIV